MLVFVVRTVLLNLISLYKKVVERAMVHFSAAALRDKVVKYPRKMIGSGSLYI
jgi:hypothetical protein